MYREDNGSKTSGKSLFDATLRAGTTRESPTEAFARRKAEDALTDPKLSALSNADLARRFHIGRRYFDALRPESGQAELRVRATSEPTAAAHPIDRAKLLSRMTLSTGEVVEEREITPALAAELVEDRWNGRNRKAREESVAAYSRDMVNKVWPVNGDTIVLAADGTLLDGQHRLMALVAAGTTMKLVVFRGVAKEAQETIDGVNPRTQRDHLRWRGVEKYVAERAALPRVLRVIATGHQTKLSRSDYQRVEEHFKASIEWVIREMPKSSHQALRRSAIIAAFAFAHRAHRAPVAEMMARYGSGDAPANAPARVLREYAMGLRGRGVSDLEIAAKTLRAIYAEIIEHKPIENLVRSDRVLAYFRERVGFNP